MKSLFSGLIFSITIMSGCASIPQDQDAQARITVAAKSWGDEFHFFYIPSSGGMADSTFIAMSKSSGPSAMVKQLVSELVKGTNSNYKLAVSGPSSVKTYQVIKDAFVLLNEKKLNHLDFMYVGAESNKEEIKSLVESAGATFVFTAY